MQPKQSITQEEINHIKRFRKSGDEYNLSLYLKRMAHKYKDCNATNNYLLIQAMGALGGKSSVLKKSKPTK